MRNASLWNTGTGNIGSIHGALEPCLRAHLHMAKNLLTKSRRSLDEVSTKSRRSLNEVSTKSQRIVDEGFFFALSAHDAEFRGRIYNFNLFFFAKLHLVEFLDLLAGFSKFYIL